MKPLLTRYNCCLTLMTNRRAAGRPHPSTPAFPPCHTAAHHAAMPPKLSQDEFDEAVRTNVEDFDMEAEEAVSSAVEEFTLQGYSLEGIIKSSSGGKTDSHPIAVATRELATAAAAATEAGDQLQGHVSALQQQFRGLSTADLQQALAVANKEGSVAALLAALATAATPSGSSSSTANDSASAARVQLPCLQMLRLLMQLPDCRAAFLAGNGAELLQRLMRSCWATLQTDAASSEAGCGPQQQLYQLAAAVAALAEAASWQDEEGKCRFIDIGFAADLLALLQRIGTTRAISSTDAPPSSKMTAVPPAAAAAGAAAGALRAFTTADDERPPSSKAFMHARLLAGPPHSAMQALLPVLQALAAPAALGEGRPLGPLIAVLGAVRQIAANDEICKAFSECGGVATLQGLLAAATEAGSPPELVRACAGGLRQLANSDAVKAELAEAGVLGTLLRAVRVYGPGQAGVQEQLLGLLVAMVLRMPDISTAAAEAGAVDVLTEVLAAAPAMAAEAKRAKGAAAANGSKAGVAAAPQDAGTPGDQDAATAAADDLAHRVFGVGISSSAGGNGAAAAEGAVQRQACMAVRNMVVRNTELRPGFLAAGAEPLLRAVKGVFPAACKDVASAALRDLGLDDYQD